MSIFCLLFTASAGFFSGRIITAFQSRAPSQNLCLAAGSVPCVPQHVCVFLFKFNRCPQDPKLETCFAMILMRLQRFELPYLHPIYPGPLEEAATVVVPLPPAAVERDVLPRPLGDDASATLSPAELDKAFQI